MADNNKGFGLVEIIIALAIVGLMGFIGWRVWDANQNTTPDGTQTSRTDSSTPTEVNSDSDLDRAAKTLDATNVEGTESKDLNSQTNF